MTANTPPGSGDVLAEEDDALVALELLGERVADRVRGTRGGRRSPRSCRELRRALVARVGVGRGLGARDRGVDRARATSRSTASISCSVDAVGEQPLARRAAAGRARASARPPPSGGTSPGRTSSGRSGGRCGTRAASGRRRRGRARPPRGAASWTARTSLPSTTAAGIPYAAARAGDVDAGGDRGHRRELAVEVVLADEHRRQRADRGEVQALVEVALVRRAVAEERRPRRGPGAWPRAPRPVAAAMLPPTIP